MKFAVAAASLALAPAATGATPPSERCRDADLRPTGSNLNRVNAAMLCLLNVERRREDRGPLTLDSRLRRSAEGHARDMTRRGYFAHARRGGPVLLERITRAGYFKGAYTGLYSENLGYGPPERASAATMTRAFSLSPSHRKTMLYGRFRNVGVASVLIGPHPAFYADYPAVVFTLDFGRRYVRRKTRCRHARAAGEQNADSRGRALPPRRWCRRRSSG